METTVWTQLVGSKELSDAKILIKTKQQTITEIPIHKIFLAFRSEYFKMKFTSWDNENDTTVNLTDEEIDYDIMIIIIKYIYSGFRDWSYFKDDINNSNIKSLICACSFFLLNDDDNCISSLIKILLDLVYFSFSSENYKETWFQEIVYELDYRTKIGEHYWFDDTSIITELKWHAIKKVNDYLYKYYLFMSEVCKYSVYDSFLIILVNNFLFYTN